jgi:preprotein translocase subunit YajC
MMHPANEKKNYGGYILLAVVLMVLFWLLLESRQRSKQIDNVLKQTTIKNQE